jgi:hypothetical protein
MGQTANTRLVLLGTSGGPLPSPVRAGIAQAIVVGGRAYLVDCGYGASQQLRRARLLISLSGVFLTHLHSDHDCDYFNLFLLGCSVAGLGDEFAIEITTEHELDVLRVRVEAMPGGDEQALAADVAREVRARCELRPVVEVLAHGTLPPTERKARRVTDLRCADRG